MHTCPQGLLLVPHEVCCSVSLSQIKAPYLCMNALERTFTAMHASPGDRLAKSLRSLSKIKLTVITKDSSAFYHLRSLSIGPNHELMDPSVKHYYSTSCSEITGSTADVIDYIETFTQLQQQLHTR